VNVAPTILSEATTRRLWDAVVVGAGPAGAMAARELARKGIDVLLVDRARFPRYKVCGGCLNPRALRLLRKAGLGGMMTRLGAVPLSQLRVGSFGSAADVSIPRGAAVSRELLDAALIREAIAAGAEFLSETTAMLLPVDSQTDRRSLRLRNGGRDLVIEAKIVLAAGGLASKLEDHVDDDATLDARIWELGSRVGAGAMAPMAAPGYSAGIIYMACAAEGYVGQVVVEDGRVDISAALDPIAVKTAGGTGELAALILERAGFPPVAGLASLAWKGTPHLTRRAPRLGAHRVFVLGDAAGYVEPFTGEGMAWALAGATLVTPLVRQALADGWSADLLTLWQASYLRAVRRRQAICRITAAVLRRPRATRTVIRALSVLPWLAWPVTGAMYRE
jgi:menaquinone-9 beta-reductase